MLKSRTTPTAMHGGISTSRPDAGNALGQAITALRGGEPAGLGPEPVVAENGVLAAAALAKLASCLPAALVLRVGTADAPLLARCRDLASIEAAAVFKYDAAAGGLERVSEARVPLADAENARIIAFRPRDGGGEHLAILIGAPDPTVPVLVRLHSECFTGDLLASLRSDRTGGRRGAALLPPGGTRHWSPQQAAGHQLQDAGFDTLDANEQLGFDVNERVYLPAAEMLRQLGFGMVRLLTNNPDKVVAMGRYVFALSSASRTSSRQADTTYVTCAQRGPAAVTLPDRIAAPSRQPTQIAALPPT